MKHLLYISSIIMLLLINTLSAAQNDSELPEDAQEGFFRLHYAGIISNDISTLVIGRDVYVPLVEIFSKLQVYNVYDHKNKVVEGFFCHQDTVYKLDFIRNNAEINGRKIYFDKDYYLLAPLDIYVKPEFFREVFDFNVLISFSNLSVGIDKDFEFPVLSKLKREREYAHIGSSQLEENYLPLKFGRNSQLLNGGLFTYMLKGETFKSNNSLSWATNTGLQMLGGDLRLNYSGSYSKFNTVETIFNNGIEETIEQSSSRTYNRIDGVWRYFISENPYMSQVQLGYLSTGGFRRSSISSKRFRGIQMTNEINQHSMFFTNFELRDRIEPGWQVELYRNGQLVDQQITDPQGFYNFQLPINYGTSNIELKYYGKGGQFYSTRDMFVIPSEFLKPGEFKYNASFGEALAVDTTWMGDAMLSMGVTDWLSNTVNLNYQEGRSDFQFFNSTSIRLLGDLFAIVDVSPENMYKAHLNFWPYKFGSYRMSYTKYEANSEYAQFGGLKQDIDFNASLPRLFKLPFNLTYRANLREYRDSYVSSMNLATYVTFYPFFVRFAYTNNMQLNNSFDVENTSQLIFTTISFNWYNKPDWLKILGATRFSTGFDYNPDTKDINRINLSMSQVLGKMAIAQVNGSYTTRSKDFYVRAGLRIDFDYFKSQSEANSNNMEDITFSQQISGTVGVNPTQGYVHANNPTTQTSIGSGAANIRVFLDENLNEEYDDGEEIIEGVRFRIPRASVDRRSSGGMTQAYNLTAFGRYNVYLDINSIKNPLWIPKFTEFSFIADPNVYKPIDIPCYAGSVIEGYVSKKVNEKSAPQAGVKVHVRSKEDTTYHQEIPVFSDGSYYYMGVPPGEYYAYIDSTQLSILEYKQEEVVEFSVKRSIEGDYIEELNITLVPLVEVEEKEELKKKVIREEVIAEAEIKRDTTSIEDIVEDIIPKKDSVVEPKKNIEDEVDKIKISENKTEYFFFEGMRSYLISDNLRKYLDEVADYLRKNPNAELAIIGHTDNFGTLKETQDISEKRADAVVNYLVSKGIPKYRLFAQGSGARSPIASNTSEKGRATNRRVEIKVIRK